MGRRRWGVRLLPGGNAILQRHDETRPLPGGSLRPTNGGLMRHTCHTIRKSVAVRVLYSTSLRFKQSQPFGRVDQKSSPPIEKCCISG